jgi:antitoxin component of MazEF toxin-antitoxin module
MTEGAQFTIRTSIRKVGNSKGVILSGKMLSELNLVEGSEVEVSLSDTGILISPVLPKTVQPKKEENREVSAWDNQFKAAIKACESAG